MRDCAARGLCQPVAAARPSATRPPPDLGVRPPGTIYPALSHPAGRLPTWGCAARNRPSGPQPSGRWAWRLARICPPSRAQPVARCLARAVYRPAAYRPAAAPRAELPGCRARWYGYEAVLVAARSRPFACGVQGTPSPLPGVGWDEGPQAGELFTQVPHIARYIVRHAGYHAEGTGPGHPDIWVPPTAL
jgi:hypothetical protein